jgi:hypothetical protein
MVFKREYQIDLTFKKENVIFKNIYMTILEFMIYSEIETGLIDFQYENAELMSIHARIHNLLVERKHLTCRILVKRL